MVLREVQQWVNRCYPKPSVDPEWLEQCYNYLVDELHIGPNDTSALTQSIESQLLQSDLHDSMLAHTGLPDNPAALHGVDLPPFLLLQVVSIMEIGHSAFSLLNTRQAWQENLAGLAGAEDEADDEIGDTPRYPRGMLSLELSDGYNIIKAIEFRRLDVLRLGQTPLGYKIVLKNVPVRRGVAMLQPANVEMRGYSNEELDAHRDTVLTRGLRERMGLPAEGREEGAADATANGQQRQDEPAPQPQAPRQSAPAAPVRQRAPPPTAPRGGPAGDHSISSYFPGGGRPGPSVQLPSLPAQTRLQAQPRTDDSIDFDDDMDDNFLREVEMVERQATSQIGTSRPGAAQTHGDVIAISDSEEEDKENIPVPVRKRRRREEPTEVIELSE
ncbi:hypothetical protein CALVIDRAFT_509829 [Calocera viscosa TUFC12733]|uniref:RecQ-mediated genome instability protein 1 n=1 Tax=Calocera viscosa (strain TUFC12733) TaxID=1330018 RepID=A0A167R5B0_CALVF|nr:hypothetical protein CALVIDRAFT_509829 [Calocera viscosa TUFC12733]